jgi:hypothetical protein
MELAAIEADGQVSGEATFTHESDAPYTFAFACSREADDVLILGGTVAESEDDEAPGEQPSCRAHQAR